MGGRYRPPALRGFSASGGRLSVSGERPPLNTPPPNPPATAGAGVSLTVTTPSVDDLAPPPPVPPNTAAALGDLLPPPPSSYPSGFRRARAGTLPSNVHLAQYNASSTTTTLNNPSSSTAANDNIIEESPVASPMMPVRPTLRHAASSAMTTTSRLRSGSLNVPAAGFSSNAFGPGIFSSWLTNPSSGGGFSALDELRSIGSGDSQMDEHDVHTLDYLGLDDAPWRSPPPATVSELRNQAQAAIAANSLSAMPSSRTRASTVSNPYRRRQVSTLLPTPSADIEEAAEPDEYMANQIEQMQFDVNNNINAAAMAMGGGYVAKGFKPSVHLGVATSSRPRAISVGMLDDPTKLVGGRRATVTVPPPGLTRKTSYNDLQISHHQQPTTASLLPSAVHYPNAISAGVSASIMRQMLPQTINVPAANASVQAAQTTTPIRGGGRQANMTIATGNGQQQQLSAPLTGGRSVSPGREGGQGQVPSRSLWIGNLDPAVTGEDLAHVFAPYGAIESFRLLPEKVCPARLYHRGHSHFISTFFLALGMRLRQFRRRPRRHTRQGRRPQPSRREHRHAQRPTRPYRLR